jgi:hypothetical protein
MEDLTRTELAVLKAIFERDLTVGHAPIYVRGLDRPAIRAAVARLGALGLVDVIEAAPAAKAAEEEWIPGNVTASGREWLKVYGLERP